MVPDRVSKFPHLISPHIPHLICSQIANDSKAFRFFCWIFILNLSIYLYSYAWFRVIFMILQPSRCYPLSIRLYWVTLLFCWYQCIMHNSSTNRNYPSNSLELPENPQPLDLPNDGLTSTDSNIWREYQDTWNQMGFYPCSWFIGTILRIIHERMRKLSSMIR